MRAPSPRVDGLEYSELYGLLVFRCDQLRASLQPHQCADRWRNSEIGSSCNGCQTGAAHAGEKPNQAKVFRLPCVRCGSTVQRLISGVICVSCFNRQREVLRGKNAKGAFPVVAGSTIRQAYAIVRQPNAAEEIRRVYFQRRSKHETIHGIRADHLPGTPYLEILDEQHVWFDGVVGDSAEIERVIARLLPGAVIDNFEIGETFTDQWRSRIEKS